MSAAFAFRKTSESFDGFTWDAANRERHFLKHGVDFPVVLDLDWSHIKKAPDLRHRSNRAGQEPRHVALAYHRRLAVVLVIVYSKRNRMV